MKVWVTKYALTNGIIEGEGRTISENSIEFNNEKHNDAWFYGNDWHTDRNNAVKKAEEMRLKKIISLQKQIKKLEGLKFE